MRKYVCNMCGKVFDAWDVNEGVSIHKYCGYGSRYDGQRIGIDLCGQCVDNLIEACMISPVVEE